MNFMNARQINHFLLESKYNYLLYIPNFPFSEIVFILFFYHIIFFCIKKHLVLICKLMEIPTLLPT